MRPIGEAVTEATLPRDPWSTAMQALQGDPEANRKAALAITGALSLPAKGVWSVLKADADYAKANRDAAKASSGLDTIGGNPGGIDLISGMGLPIMAKALRAGDKAADVATGIRAYHGSPHDFDRFDMSKIGTGEGAQAYGHGLYFAEKEGVARSYRDALSGVKGDASWAVISPIMRKHNIPGDFPPGARPDSVAATILKEYGHKLSDVERRAIQAEINPGRMYEVNIAARPEQFLDWDKPLAAQAQIVDALRSSRSPKIREIAAGPEIMAPSRSLYGRDLGPVTGEDIYKRIALATSGGNVGGSLKTTAALNNAGIPGIRYLDQGSRASDPARIAELQRHIANYERAAAKKPDDPFFKEILGDLRGELTKLQNPTSNYVLFRDDIINILRKYGIPGAGVAGAGAFAGGAPDATAEALRKKP